MRFADIPGHDEVKRRLRDMADIDRIPHALLLEGPEGIGKFALARAFAQYVHCTDRTSDGDSCGRCPSCLQHQGFNHIDTLYSFPLLKKKSRPTVSDDYASEFRAFMSRDLFMPFAEWLDDLGNANGQPMIYVEEATRLLERLNLAAHQGEYKIVLMWLPERLRPEAANKLLKLVEEPFHDTIFVMTSSSPRLILPTIYSRTQRIAVAPYAEEEVARWLTDRHPGAPSAAVQAAAALSHGSMSVAGRMLVADHERLRHLELFMQLMRLAWQRKIVPLRAWSLDVAALGREGSMRFYGYCSRLLRENFILNIDPADAPLITSLSADERAFCTRFCPYVNERNVVELMGLFDDAISHTAINGNAKIIAFDVAVQAILLLKR